jgi:ribosomal protein S18 acetylase RimI-like enzyme
MRETDRVLRSFTRADQPAVRHLVLEGMRERWQDEFDAGANPDVDDVWATYVEGGADVIVAEEEGVIVATGTLVSIDDTDGRIVRVAVDRRCRRRGFARLVIGELLRRARLRSMRAVIVTTEPAWSDAADLYRSCGFRLVARSPDMLRFESQLNMGRGQATGRTRWISRPRRVRPSGRA